VLTQERHPLMTRVKRGVQSNFREQRRRTALADERLMKT
jgi:hypothetical protein